MHMTLALLAALANSLI